jgi:hypothetical protein
MNSVPEKLLHKLEEEVLILIIKQLQNKLKTRPVNSSIKISI